MKNYKYEVIVTNADSTYLVLWQNETILYMCEYRNDNNSLYNDLGNILINADVNGWGFGRMEEDMYDYDDFNAYYTDLMSEYGENVNAPRIISSGEFTT